MAQSVSGLTAERTTVYKRKLLPLLGEVLVKVGDRVTSDTIVARTFVPGDIQIVDFSTELQTDAELIEDYILKKVGDPVEENEIIGRYEALFGLIKRSSQSPITGTIDTISDVTGKVIIQGTPVPVEIRAHVPGVIAEVIPKEGVVIKTVGLLVQGILGIGGEDEGELKMVSESPHDVLTADQIGPDCAGKILVGGSLVELDALKTAVSVGAKAIVVGGIQYPDLSKFIGREIGVAITGDEEVGLTLVITEGFSRMNMADRRFDLLKRCDGMVACIDGTTQIRAGVIRPEVIVPLEEGGDLETKTGETVGLTIDSEVRVIRGPDFGALGRVVSLPVELLPIDTESKVRVVEVKLEDNRTVKIPRANVELVA